MAIGDTNFFVDFPKVNYRFGSNELPVRFQDLSIYIDIFDQVAEYSSYYENYQIQNNERPDHTSYTLYGRADYHWTFFLLNEKLRKSGWPLDNFRLFDQAKQYYPHITVTTRGSVYRPTTDDYMPMAASGFIEGATVWFPNTETYGKIVKINHDLGQLVIKMADPSLYPIEEKGKAIHVVTEEQALVMSENLSLASGILSTAPSTDIDGPDFIVPPPDTLRSAEPISYEYDSIHHFENADGDWINPSYYKPDVGFNNQNPPTPLYPGSYALKWSDVNTIQSITYLERLQLLNEEQRAIQVIKPDAITQIVSEFRSLLR